MQPYRLILLIHHPLQKIISDDKCGQLLKAIPPPKTTTTAEPYWELTSGSQYCEIVDGGRCVTDGAGDYGPREICRIDAQRQFYVYTEQYEVDGCCDYLQIGCTKFKTRGPHGVKVAQGTPIYWSSDGSVQDKGWKICASETPMNVTHPPTRPLPSTTTTSKFKCTAKP